MKKLIKYELLPFGHTYSGNQIFLIFHFIVFVIGFIVHVSTDISTDTIYFVLRTILWVNLFVACCMLNFPLLGGEVPLNLLSPIKFSETLIARQISSLIYIIVYALFYLVLYHTYRPYTFVPLGAWQLLILIGICLLFQSVFVLSVVMTRIWLAKTNSLRKLEKIPAFFHVPGDESVFEPSFASLTTYVIFLATVVALPVAELPLTDMIFLAHAPLLAFLLAFSAYLLNAVLLLLNAHLLELYGTK